jgi:hypothetical protein
LNSGLNSVVSEVDQLQIWSASINQISDNGILQGTSTRLSFYGLVSASIVPNVNGNIASILIEQDGTKLNSSSFNAYTASTNQRVDSLEVWSGSARISIAALNSFTASVGPIQTSSLLLTSSFSGDKLTFTKGNATTYFNEGIQNTASFNSYTASALTSLNQFTASNGNTSLNTFTASIAGTNAFTASTNIAITALNSFTASQNTKNATLAPITASLLASQSADDFKWQTIGGVTSSLISKTGSYATTGSNSFTGSNIFTGSLTITGSAVGNISTLSIASNTASLDCSTGSFFTLTLPDSVNTLVNATNIKSGTTINLLITQAATPGTITFSSNIDWPTNYAYSASAVSGAKDLVSMVSFDTTTLYAASVKNLK